MSGNTQQDWPSGQRHYEVTVEIDVDLNSERIQQQFSEISQLGGRVLNDTDIEASAVGTLADILDMANMGSKAILLKLSEADAARVEAAA